MKKMKKLLSMLLAVVMVLAMAAPSFAEVVTSGTITVENAKDGHTYNAYRIFSLKMFGDGSNGTNYGYAYTVENEWLEFFTEGAGVGLVKLDDKHNVLPLEQKAGEDPVLVRDAAALAAAIRDELNDETKPEKTIAATGTYTGTEEKKEGSLTLANGNQTQLPLGYYLVDSTVGTLCALNTNAPNVKFKDKSEVPTLTKTTDPALYANVAIGDSIPYTVRITAKDGAQKYEVVDTMSKGLTFDKNVSVTKGEEIFVEDTGETATTTFKVNFEINPDTKETTLNIKFADAFCNALHKDEVIEINYSATVNDDAIVVDKLTNKAHLNYGHGSVTNSTPDEQKESRTYQIDLQKTVMGSDGKSTNTQLEGAEFSLYSTNDSSDKISLVDITPTGSKKKIYRLAKENEDGTTIISAGYAIIKGLDGDKLYYLAEDKAPVGYNAITGRVEVKPLRFANSTDVPDVAEAQVANSTGTTLPATGGIGTTIFYAAGIILMAGAVFFVVRRKKA